MTKDINANSNVNSRGPGHSRSIVKLKTAMIGGSMILNSFLIEYLLPEQVFASELSSWISAVARNH